MRKKASIYHHTHWDNEWYFTEEDSLIQLSYHMKELLYALNNNIIDYFYLDGQTAILEDYIELHKEDTEMIETLIKNKKLFVGPFHTQLDSFITSGESVINNLRYGITYANDHGGSSMVAYLPDSFGQSQDFPKIFNHLKIDSFVFRRGMGKEHQLPLDFVSQSNDGSKVVTTTLDCGYGFATEPFINKTLTKNAGLDYDGKDIKSQLEKLANLSTLENEFLLPIGNDQTPVIWNFKQLLDDYKNDETYEFEETTLANYMEKLIKNVENLKTYKGEFINPQYHRVHRSIYSARMDIKIVQDQVERMMALEIQPIMSILDDMGFAYDKKIVDRIWNLLARSQTHSAATNTDKTNELILKRSEKAYNLAEALKIYLVRKIAISINSKLSPVVIFNTLPFARDMIVELEVYTKGKSFSIKHKNHDLDYTVVTQEKEYGGTIRKDNKDYDKNKYFYKTKIIMELKAVEAFSYLTLYIDEAINKKQNEGSVSNYIENEFYIISKDNKGLNLYVKETKETISNFLYLEESGDEGDNYDYSYPTKDMINIDYLESTTCSFMQYGLKTELTIEGSMSYPCDLASREKQLKNCEDDYCLNVTLKKNDRVIGIKGNINNTALNHRIRVIAKSNIKTDYSVAGTQFGFIKRESNPSLMKIWKKEGWLEEPSPIYPLLNYVAAENENTQHVVFTKSSKEYEMIGEHKESMAITVFRSVGHLGLPDLNRRPGRASGIAEKIIPSPKSQMIGKQSFEVGIMVGNKKSYSEVVNIYNEFAVSEAYYQNQSFNRVVYPISYFHTNPLNFIIEDHYSLKAIPELESLAFSTLEKMNEKYLLRVFNNETAFDLNRAIIKLDMYGNEICEETTIRTGEIINCDILNGSREQ